TVIAFVALVKAEAPWAELDDVYECAIEFSPGWPDRGALALLLEFALDQAFVEEVILVATLPRRTEDQAANGDGDGVELLLRGAGFTDLRGASRAAGAGSAQLLARIGSKVANEVYDRFR